MTATGPPGGPPLPAPGAPPAAAPEWAYAAALAGLPFMTWDRLGAVLADGPPSRAWAAVVAGRAGSGWARAARAVRVDAVAPAHARAGAGVHLLGDPAYPGALAGDHQAPPVLFHLGDPAAVGPPGAPRAAVVGTRRATGYGRDVARELGRHLAGAGVRVVSGLALGIDGAAHRGALDAGAAPPVAVVGSGLDVTYPRRHAGLWREVAAAGVVLSEAPLGARPEPWRFPARNRLVAALAGVVVVVESPLAGGSFHTVRAAEERGRTVMAVPGPVRSPASAGTNRLISEGCPPACDADDVLVALSLHAAGGTPGPADGPQRPPPSGPDAAVLDLLGWEPTALDRVLGASDLPPATVSAALARLEDAGWARGRAGWWERVGGA